MTRPATSHGADNNPRYLIAATTALPLPLEPCVKPPKEREAEFQEILADLEARKAAQKTLKRELTLAKPYELLSPEQVRAFQAQRGRPTPAGAGPTPSEFAGAADVFTFSDDYFSQNGKLALKAVSTWCGAALRALARSGRYWRNSPRANGWSGRGFSVPALRVG